MTASDSRPVAVTTAFWLLVLGAVLLMAGGLMSATLGFDTLRRSAPQAVSDQTVQNYLRLYRGAGVLLAGVLVLARGSIHSPAGALIAAVSFALLWRTRVNAALIVVGAAVLGAVLGL